MSPDRCLACKTPLDPSLGPGARCPICGSPVIQKRTAASGDDDTETLVRRHAALSSRYEIGGLIGRGRAGDVLRGTDRSSGELVAIKILARLDDARVNAALKAEEFLALPVEHSGVVNPTSCGVLPRPGGGEMGWLVSPFVDGRSLASELACGALPAGRALRVLASLLGALAAVHRAGGIHQDPKPTDVLLTGSGEVRLTDVGVPRDPLPVGLLGRPLPAGTLEYLAPEVIEGAPASTASDMFAVGVMAHEMLTGANPFRKPSLREAVTDRPRVLPPLPADLAQTYPDLVALIADLTLADPALRPDAASALVRAQSLARQASARGNVVRLPVSSPRPETPELDEPVVHESPRMRVVEAIALLATAIGTLVWAVWPGGSPVATPRFAAGTRSLVVWLPDGVGNNARLRWTPPGERTTSARTVAFDTRRAGRPSALVEGLEPGKSYRLAILDGDEGRALCTFQAATFESGGALVKSWKVMYEPGGKARLVAAMATPVSTLAASIATQARDLSTGRTVPGTSSGERWCFDLSVPPQDRVRLALRAADVRETIELGTLEGALERFRRVSAAMAYVEAGSLGLGLGAGEGELLDDLVRRALGAADRGERVEAVEKGIDRWTTERLGIPLDELLGLGRATACDPALPGIDRWLAYRVCARLEGTSVVDGLVGLGPRRSPFADATSCLVEVERRAGSGSPPTGSHPIAEAVVPDAVKALLTRAPVPLVTGTPATGETAKLVARAAEQMAPIADTSRDVPLWVFRAAETFVGAGRRLEVAVRAAGLGVGTRIVVDLGGGAEIVLRSVSPPRVPVLAGADLPERSALEATSEWLVARFDHEEAVDRVGLAARNASTSARVNDRLRQAGPDADHAGAAAFPPLVWVVDLVLKRM